MAERLTKRREHDHYCICENCQTGEATKHIKSFAVKLMRRRPSHKKKRTHSGKKEKLPEETALEAEEKLITPPSTPLTSAAESNQNQVVENLSNLSLHVSASDADVSQSE